MRFQFSFQFNILLTETPLKLTEKQNVWENSFPKIGHFSFFHNGLNPQIAENKRNT